MKNLCHSLRLLCGCWLFLHLGGCSRQGQPQGAWETTDPSRAGIDSTKLNSGFAKLGPDAGNIVVVRKGKVVFLQGETHKPMPLYSGSKSVLALLFGTLVQNGSIHLDSIIVDEKHPEKPSYSVEHLLSMRSNYGLKLHASGKHYAYNNRAYQFLGEELHSNHFMELEPAQIFEQALMDPIGHEDAIHFTGQWGGWDGGVKISASDLARLGLLVLNQGRWNELQVVCGSFIKSLFVSQIPEDALLTHERGPNDEWNQHHLTNNLKGKYSYGWWLGSTRDGKARTIRMSGRGGNLLIVYPELDLVIAVTNDKPTAAPSSGDYLKTVENAVKKKSP